MYHICVSIFYIPKKFMNFTGDLIVVSHEKREGSPQVIVYVR
jgi:hypothetical protein